MSTRSADVVYSRGKLRANTRKLDAAQRATAGQITALSARIDEQFGSDRGSLLHRYENGWDILAPGTSGHFLKSNGPGADLSYAAITQPKWELIESRAVNGVEEFTDLSAFTSIKAVLIAVTSSGSGFRIARVSADNGSNFLSSSGDYISINANGVEGNVTEISLIGTNSALARGSIMQIDGFNAAVAHKAVSLHGGFVFTGYRIPTASALNALQISDTVGTPSGGTIQLWGVRG